MTKQEIIEKYGIEEYNRQLEQKKAYYLEHKEKIYERHRQYYENNKEKIKVINRKWHQEHREEHNAINRKWQQEHREKHNAYMKKYYQTLEGRATSLLKDYRRLDKKFPSHNGECTLTKEQVIELIQQPCHYCGSTEQIGLDRVCVYRPHEFTNVVPCCAQCNIERQQMPYEEFKAKKEASQKQAV